MEQEKDVVGRRWILNKIVYIATFLRSEIGIQHAVKLSYIIDCQKTNSTRTVKKQLVYKHLQENLKKVSQYK